MFRAAPQPNSQYNGQFYQNSSQTQPGYQSGSAPYFQGHHSLSTQTNPHFMAGPPQTLPNPADGAVFHNPGYSPTMVHTGPGGGVSPHLSITPVQQQAFYPGHSNGVTSPTPYSQQNPNAPDHFLAHQQPVNGPVRANNNQVVQGQSSGSSMDKVANLVKTQLKDPATIKQAVSVLGKAYKVYNKAHHPNTTSHHPHHHHPHHHHHHHHLL